MCLRILNSIVVKLNNMPMVIKTSKLAIRGETGFINIKVAPELLQLA
jgi:hypothetical protein